jgi:UDP-N-acetylmuramoylalanine--D-glutamate ligase
MAAVAAADAWGVPAAVMREAIRAFPGVEHRLERVRDLDGVRFYNDSIATSPTGTLAALAAIQQPIWLIAGGYDKGLPFQALGEAIVQRVQGVFLIGTTAQQIAQAIATARRPGGDLPSITFCSDLRDAVRAASGAASPGEVVLLSPACASYDQFRNFVERGRLFKQLVSELDDSRGRAPRGCGSRPGEPSDDPATSCLQSQHQSRIVGRHLPTCEESA